jgi:apolipoprotein N-acyltransferase
MLREIKKKSLPEEERVKRISVFLPLLTPILLILAFPNPQISILAWIAFIPLFFAIDNSSKRKSFCLSYFIGFIFFGGTLYWLAYVTKLGYLILTFYLALYFGLFGLIANILFNRLHASKLYFLLFLILPSLWVSLEFVRGIFFSGFPWAILGHTQYSCPLVIQIADITGAYGVSFLIIMVNFVLYAYLLKILKKAPYFPALRFQLIASTIILAIALCYGYYKLGKEDFETGLKLSLVQGNIEQEKKWDPLYRDYILKRYDALTQKAAGDESDLIIWPETSLPGYLGEKDIKVKIRKIIRNADTQLFIGAVTYEYGEAEDRFFNSALLFSQDGRIKKKYDKLHLVPLGEYVPFEENFPFVRGFIDVTIGDFTPGRDFTLFNIESKDGANYKYAALICFEDIFPALTRRFVDEGANFLINITNDAWFKESSEQLQHTQASVFRAVENRVSVLRAANTGFSCYINPKGVIEGAIYDRDL